MNTNKKYIPYKIKSKDRESGNEINDCNIYLHSLDQTNENYEIILSDFIINNDFLNIHSGNNNLYFSHNIGTTTTIMTPDTYTMPEKNYNSTQFLTEFNTNNTLGITADFDTQNNLIFLIIILEQLIV